MPEHKSSVLLGMYNFALESDVLIETPKVFVLVKTDRLLQNSVTFMTVFQARRKIRGHP